MIFPSLIFKIERWKFNKDFGVYVSNMGHFKDRYKRLLPIKIDQNGYCGIKTERGMKKAHRLVMLTWKPIPNAEELTVDHLNHNKRDNSLINLEWITKKENIKRANRDQFCSARLVSIRSPYISLETYRNHLVGYKIKGVVCHNIEEIFEIAKNYYNGKDIILLRKISDGLQKIEDKLETTCYKINKNINICPVFDVQKVEIEV